MMIGKSIQITGASVVKGRIKKQVSICLCLIVKNEAHVIERAIASCTGFFTHWVIVDTGSTDGTQALITRMLGSLPGELVQSHWKGFAESRNEALTLAKRWADYTLILDADDLLHFRAQQEALSLSAPAYYVWAFDGCLRHKRLLILRNDIECHWKGAIHESLTLPTGVDLEAEILPDITIRYTHEGARSKDSQTYSGDVSLLEATLSRNPEDASSRFYLARTLHWLGESVQAKEQYSVVFNANVCHPEQRWLSYFEMCRLDDTEESENPDLASRYARAIQLRPTRAEPMLCLARLLREAGQYLEATALAEHASQIEIPDDEFFVDVAAYGWKAWDEICVNALYLGDKARAHEAASRALACPFLSADERERIELNIAKSVLDDQAADDSAVRSKALGPN